MIDLARPDITSPFAGPSTPIAISTDENYLPYTKVLISSIAASSKGKIDLMVLHCGISEDKTSSLIDWASRKIGSRFSVRFIDVQRPALSGVFENFTQTGYLACASLYRLLLPEILVQYDKIVYLDVDIAVQSDIAELYAIDIGDNLFGGVEDCGMPRNTWLQPEYAEWLRAKGIEDYAQCANSGVLLMNLAEFRKAAMLGTMVNLACESKWLVDQDAFNIACKGRIKLIDPTWNIQTFPEGMRRQRKILREASPRIIHYVGGASKPWNKPETPYSDVWWRNAGEDRVPLWRRAFGVEPPPEAGAESGGGSIRVTVVMPIYNAAEYLEEALLSFEAQTLTDFEVICVDDGSTDNSPAICKAFAERDPRFRLLTQTNSGAAAARNRGAAAAKGEWLFFADSDDFCRPDMLEGMVAAGEAHGSDMVVAQCFLCYTDVDYRIIEHRIPKTFLKAAQPVKREDGLVFLPHACFAAWDKLFRRKFVVENGLEFHNTPAVDDAFFVFSAMALARSTTYLEKSYYYYRSGLSTSQIGLSDRHPTGFLEALMQVKDVLEKTGADKNTKTKFFIVAVKACFNVLLLRKNGESALKTYEAIRDGGLEALGFVGIDPEMVDLGMYREAYDLTMAGADMQAVISRFVRRKDISLTANMAKKDELIASLDAKVAKRDAWLAEAKEKLAKREATIAEKRGFIERQKENIAKRDAKLAEFREGLAKRDATIEKLRKNLGKCKKELDAIRTSRFYRMAQALCGVLDFVRGRKRLARG